MRRALLAAATVMALAGASRAEPARRLTGTVPLAAAAMAEEGPAPADLHLGYVSVVLGLRDRAGLDAVIAAQQDPRSPRFRRWLGPAEIADRFGPTPDEYERVRGWLAARGLAVVGDSPYRTALVVEGSAAAVEAAVATPIRLLARRGRTYHAPAGEPLLPESVALSVRGILGLDDLPKFRPQFTSALRLDDGHTALSPQDFASAYGVLPLQAAGLSGLGRSIAVVARSNFDDRDIAAFSSLFGVPLKPVRRLASPTSDPGILAEDGEETEVLIDTQWAGALAPGATLNVVIGTRDGNIPEALFRAVSNREGDVISISFGLCEKQAPRIAAEYFDELYAIANAQGQTVLVASGDGGGTECVPDFPREASVSALAASSHAVAVGGSSFVLADDGTLPASLVESVWNDDFGASGGGESTVFARPRYQLGPGVPALAGRAVPDLALPASPLTPGYVIVEDGRTRVVGGTSVGAPAFASILTLINERLAQTQGTTGLGQLVPTLYRLGGEQARGLRAPVFRDITIGTNAFPNAPGFAAGPGFDLATGWGAPLADALAQALEGPGRCEPELGCMVPARGPKSRSCAGAWLVEQDVFTVRRGLPVPRQSCRDGDPQCDADGTADGHCTVNVALCLNVLDFRLGRVDKDGLPACEPRGARHVQLVGPAGRRRDPARRELRAALRAAVRGLPDLPNRLLNACTTTVPVVVPLGAGGGPGHLTLRARIAERRGETTARVRLECQAS